MKHFYVDIWYGTHGNATFSQTMYAMATLTAQLKSPISKENSDLKYFGNEKKFFETEIAINYSEKR